MKIPAILFSALGLFACTSSSSTDSSALTASDISAGSGSGSGSGSGGGSDGGVGSGSDGGGSGSDGGGGGSGSDGGSGGEIDCPDGTHEARLDDGSTVCADIAEPTDAGDQTPYDPGMPAPDEVVTCDQPIPVPTPAPTTPATPGAARCANPPPLYKSVIEFYKFDLRVGGFKVGEHSTTRVKRYRWDWDATAGAYKQPVLDAQTDHSNHHNKNDARLRRYRFTDSRRTDVTGEGFRAYIATANEYCACLNDVGHLTNRDSCYSFVGVPFSQDHVCHSDTQVQGNAFLTATGKRATYPNECGLGLVHNNAP